MQAHSPFRYVRSERRLHDHRSFDDDWASCPFEIRDGRHRRCPAPGGGPRAHRSFQATVRNKVDAEPMARIARARSSLVASFASGVAKNDAAVHAAITLPSSNGRTEGQITKLKPVKRQMYVRAKIDLLKAPLIGAI
jgi:hypothetical protein